MTVLHDNTPNTGCPVLGVHINEAEGFYGLFQEEMQELLVEGAAGREAPAGPYGRPPEIHGKILLLEKT